MNGRIGIMTELIMQFFEDNLYVMGLSFLAGFFTACCVADWLLTERHGDIEVIKLQKVVKDD